MARSILIGLASFATTILILVGQSMAMGGGLH